MTTRKILVADDNANIRKVVKMGFESLGYSVITADDGRVALEKIRAERPDLVILDVMMPEKSGYDVCSEMKADAELRSIPVVMLTAKNLEEDQYWGRELGADEYITKPYDPEQLEAAVEKIFALRERGESYHPLTKLPLLAAIRHEIEQRRRSGGQFVVLACSFEPVAFETYQMKYGNIKADHVTLVTSRIIQEAVGRIPDGQAFVGHTGDNVFHLIIPPGAAGAVRDAINRDFGAAVRAWYRDDDALRGYVVKPVAGGPDECIPLLSLAWKVANPE